MAMWPAQFPPPALNTLQETPPDNIIRTQMERGPAKQRRRTTANTRPLSFTLKVPKALVDVMDNFYTVETYSGADEFDYIHPRTGLSCTARFTQPPAYSEQEGAIYNIGVSLEIMP